MADPLYPDVPLADGVPNVFRTAEGAASAQVAVEDASPLLTADNLNVQAQTRSTWGIYKADGTLSLDVDSIVSVEPGREARQSTYPVADGGFQSFNKVLTPGDCRVSVTKGGNDTERKAFLDALDVMLESTDLYSIVMPDQTMTNRDLLGIHYPRTAERGATLITVELSFEEVRVSAVAAFADSTQPEGNTATQGGPVQAVTPTIAQTPTAEAVSQDDNPALADLPDVTSDMTQAQRAAATTAMIEAGATIGQLVTKGVSFSAIPLVASAAQSLTAYLGGQSVTLDLAQRASGLFVDVSVNSAAIISGVIAQNDNAIVRSAYLGFAGDLFFHDTQGGLGDVSYTDLASRIALLYAGA